jgi:hypothetical protein
VSASSIPHTRYIPRPSHYFKFNHPHNNGWAVQAMKLLSSLWSFLHSPVTTSLLAQIFHSLPYSETPSDYVSPLLRDVVWGCLSEPLLLNKN